MDDTTDMDMDFETANYCSINYVTSTIVLGAAKAK